jgi:AmmeMemoRadiSam system protein B
MRVRLPAVAGSFYPADPAVLAQEVAESLAAAVPAAEGAPPKAVIAPHAGYVYSGPTAGYAYAPVAALRSVVSRVVVLGPAHRVWVRGLAASSAEAFETPLGRVPVDREAVEGVCALSQVRIDDRAHAAEHSLEVQLPFLQHVLGDFSLVPLAVGDATDEEVEEVLDALWGGAETLIVVSSDLSHYYDYATAKRLDAATCRAIEALEPEWLDGESACGRVPIRGLLLAAQRHGLAAHTLDLRSSGDTAGDRTRVVGYGAWTLA